MSRPLTSKSQRGDAAFAAHSINSRNHQVIKKVRRLKRRTFRDREGLFLLEGPTLISEAASSGARLTELLFVDSRLEEADLIGRMTGESMNAYEISDGLMDWISDAVTSQGIMAVIQQVDRSYHDFDCRGASLMLVADQVRDPGNLGALIRVADAACVDGFITTKGSVDLYNSKVVRSGAGSHFHVTLVRDAELSELKSDCTESGMKIFGLDPRRGESYVEVDMVGPAVLVVGNEAFGIADKDRRLLDGTVHIPMPGKAESLNVASAAAVVLFEALRQRRQEPGVKTSG